MAYALKFLPTFLFVFATTVILKYLNASINYILHIEVLIMDEVILLVILSLLLIFSILYLFLDFKIGFLRFIFLSVILIKALLVFDFFIMGSLIELPYIINGSIGYYIFGCILSLVAKIKINENTQGE